jgi:hypothetical protein
MAGQIVESTVRRHAKKAGYIVRKTRWRKDSCDNHGEYMLVNDRNLVVLGDRYDATLEDIDYFLKN